MITGITFPILSCVLALNCLQNSMMLIPLEPKAGPIGGAGLAWPPLHCSFTKPVISFAILISFGVNDLSSPTGGYLISQHLPIYAKASMGNKELIGAAKVR